MNLVFTADADGQSADCFVDSDLSIAIGAEPPVDECWVAVHGWQTRLCDFVQGLARYDCGMLPHLGRKANRLSVGLHWPSSLTENVETKILDAATFWMMERRADVVGMRAGADLINSIIRSQKTPIRLVLIGHSFGCKVLCAALQQLATAGADFHEIELICVLLQAAFESDALELRGKYGHVASLPIRMLVTTSKLDRALGEWFPLAAAMGDPLRLFSHKDRQAMGSAGPTPDTRREWGSRLTAADLTPIHAQNPLGGASGNHSDIFGDPILELVATYVRGTGIKPALAIAA